jgi:FAD-dependent urate hydroxylase
MPETTDVAIIGAGPYGLSVASHLGAKAVDFRIFGQPLVTWRRMLPGINLKSPDFGSNIYTPDAGNTFIEWCDARGLSRAEPIPMSRFTEYALDTQRRILPMVEQVDVTRIRPHGDGFDVAIGDSPRIQARRVVVATGLSFFARIPDALAGLPRELVSHTSDHTGYQGWNGRQVVVVGSGQSAVEAAAALLESGATVSMVTRQPTLRFTPVPSGRPRSVGRRLRYPRTVVGEGWLNYSLQHAPLWPHFQPERLRVWLTRKHLGPYATWWLRDVEARVSFMPRSAISAARARGSRVELAVRGDEDGTRERVVRADHIVCGTGYETDVERIPFLAPELAARIARIERAPRLSTRFESSVPGLYFVGPASSFSFGPLFRFVCGAEYAAPAVARHLAAGRGARRENRVFQLG